MTTKRTWNEMKAICEGFAVEMYRIGANPLPAIRKMTGIDLAFLYAQDGLIPLVPALILDNDSDNMNDWTVSIAIPNKDNGNSLDNYKSRKRIVGSPFHSYTVNDENVLYRD